MMVEVHVEVKKKWDVQVARHSKDVMQ